MNVTQSQPRFAAGRFEMKPKSDLNHSDATILRAKVITYVQNRRSQYDEVDYGDKTFDPVTVVINPDNAYKVTPAGQNTTTVEEQNNSTGWLKTQGKKLVRATNKLVAKTKAKFGPMVNYALKVKSERALFKFVQSEPNLEVRYTSLSSEKKSG